MNNNEPALNEKQFYASNVDDLQRHALLTLPKPVEDILHSEGLLFCMATFLFYFSRLK